MSLEFDDESKLGKKKRQAFTDFRHDYKKAKSAKSEIDDLISDWNDLYYGYSMGNEEEGKSKFVMKEIAKQIEWMMPNLTEPFTSTSHPVKVAMGKHQRQASKIERYLNTHFTSAFDREAFIEQLGDVLLREGTVWIKSGWEYKEEITKKEITYNSMDELMENPETPDTVKQNKDGTLTACYKKTEMIRNLGTAVIQRNENVFPDPDAKTMEELRFVAIRRYVTMSDLTRTKLYDEDQLEKLEASLEKNSDSSLSQARTADNESYGQKGYTPNDRARQKIEIIEYWGEYDLDGDGIAEPIVATWAVKGDVNLRIEPSPMPSKRIPLYREVYSARPFSIWGNALAFFLGDNQKIKTGIMRGILDNMSLSNNGQKFIARGTLDYVNFKKMRNGHRHIIVNRPDGIQDGSFNQLPGAVFNTMNMVDKEIQEMSGVNSGGASLRQSDLAKDDGDNQITMSQQRMAKLVRGVGSLIGKIMKDWVEMAEIFLSNEQIEDLFGEEEEPDVFILTNSKRANISLRVGTEVNRQRESHNLNMLMQQSKTLAENAPPHIYNGLVAKNFELYDMYEYADELRNYRPEPSPQQQKAQQLSLAKAELEVAKLNEEILEIKMRANSTALNAQTNAMKGNAENNYKNAKAREADASTQGKEVNTALEPVKVQTEIEKSRQGDTRANE